MARSVSSLQSRSGVSCRHDRRYATDYHALRLELTEGREGDHHWAVRRIERGLAVARPVGLGGLALDEAVLRRGHTVEAQLQSQRLEDAHCCVGTTPTAAVHDEVELAGDVGRVEVRAHN